MFMLNNTFMVIIYFSLLGVYLLNIANNIRLDNEGNIYKEWSERNNGKKYYERENSFFGNFFKKTFSWAGDEKYISDEFLEFIYQMPILLRTIFILICGVCMIYLICIIFVRAIRSSSCRGRYTHILEPDRFDGSQNARAWLENVESFLEGKRINDGSGKCLAVLSRPLLL